MKPKEVDLSTLYEDPYFDLTARAKKKKKTFRDRKATITFGAVPGEDPEEPEPDPNAAQGPQSEAPTAAQT